MPNELNEESMDLLENETNLESQDGLAASVEEAGTELEDQDEQIITEQVPVAPEFSHPHLQGKTPQEIESLFNLMQNTVQSQTRRINELAEVPPQAAPEVTPEPSGDFFEDPLGHLRREMNAAVAPINQEIANIKAQTQVNQAWQVAEAKFADFGKFRPYIEQMLANSNIPVASLTPQLVESYYYGAKGYVATHNTEEAATPEASPQRPPPPQHRPSGAPLPQSLQGNKPRELTEDERRLSREWGMSAEEFIKWGEMDEEEVAVKEVQNA